jgi:orotidine-5'-phosphate decarboxylase
MSIKRQTGIILSLGTESKYEIEKLLKKLDKSMDALYLKNTLIIRESTQIIKALKNIIKENGSSKPIIVDYRMDQEDVDEIEEITELLESEGANAMTIMGVYDESFVKFCIKHSKIQLFSIIDVGLSSFKVRFSDASIVQNALFAQNNKCSGIVMTSRYMMRIRKVRDATLGFPILAIIEKEDEVGSTLPFGSDFEIVSGQLLRRKVKLQ